jgi:hypothetical protein
MANAGSKQKETQKGYVYIFVCDSLEGLVKIGQTTDIRSRINSASTWTPTGYDCVFALESEQYKDIEKLVHFAYRHCWEGREFFKIPLEDAIRFFQKLAKLGIAKVVPTNALTVKPEKEFKKGDKVRADNTTFKSLGISPGSELVFKDKPAEVCQTYDTDNKVKYKGEVMSLSALASKLANSNVSGYWYFKYEGRILWDIRLKKLDSQNDNQKEFEFSGD